MLKLNPSLPSILASLSATSLLVLPWLGVVGFCLLLLYQRKHKVIYHLKPIWLTLWLGVFIPLTISALLRRDWGDVLTLLLQLGLILLFGFFTISRRHLIIGFSLASCILALGALWEIHVVRTSWHSYEETNSNQRIGLLEDINRIASYSSRRLWRVPKGTTAFQLNLEARLYSGTPNWTWRTSPPFQIESHIEDEEVFTRAYTPIDNDPHLMRFAMFPNNIASTQVRVRIELRDAGEKTISFAGLLYLFGSQEYYVTLPISLTPRWQEHELVWLVPENFIGRQLTVVLNDFDGLTFDIRNMVLEYQKNGAWIEVEAMEPTGVALWLDFPNHDSDLRQQQLRFIPNSTWQRYSLSVNDPRLLSHASLRSVLTLEQGIAIETRQVELVAILEDGIQKAKAITDGHRVSLWFEDPNLAGHSATIAILGIVFFFRLGGLRGLLYLCLPLAFSIVFIYLTGSRAAWLALCVGILWMLWVKSSAVYVRILSVASVVILLAASGISFWNEGWFLRTDEPISRTEIWQLSWHAFLDNPLLGIGTGTFIDYWSNQYAGEDSEIVTHAHNLWLAFLSSYGVFGFASSLWLTLGMLYICWSRYGWRGIAFMLALIIMNILDNTFFFAGVLFPLLITLLIMLKTSESPSSKQVHPLL